MPKISRMFGVETEFFLTDEEGNISNKADMILKEARKRMKNTDLTEEAGQSMIEAVTFAHISSREIYSKFLEDMESILYETEANDLGLYFYGTYPGINTTKARENQRYETITKIFGKNQVDVAGKCIGFHFHYSLPRNSFSDRIKFFYPDIKEKKQKTIVNMYNLYTALDPAITSFMQSSPYFEGKYCGKDSRMMVYRGDKTQYIS